ncbi:MAG TPA: TolC family protein [Candidatus Aminicenantes bacterium]|nr:TolC family protein [Candidatus Aminicenantes bacterium]HRY64196.1 TolC family protein [Candidatus Aminicenantes bacterium]HRZ71109.1 TolC family protein [Candidatus Aminicenantes bacterium]
MKLKTIPTLIAAALIAAAPAAAQQARPGTLSLSLDECIARALRDNLGVAIQVLGPQISAEGVSQAREKYLPTLSMSARSSKSENAAYSYLDATADSTIAKARNYTFLTASQFLPTGGTLNLNFTGNRNTSNSRGQTINPRYGTTLSFNLTQPLLKNFGLKINQREILVARNNLGVSDETLRNTLMTTVFNVESAYWNLIYSIESLDVRRQSLQLAKDLLDKNQRSVEVGTLAPIEVLSAQAEVATREADLIQAEAQIQSNEDQLKLLLHITGEEDKATTALVPKDKPTYVARQADLEEALAAAIENRTDLKIAKYGLETDRLNLGYAKNQVLPDLSFSASYSSPGIDGTRLIYSNNDPIYGDVIDTIPGDIGGALKQTFKMQYPNWNVGLTLSLPLANVFSRAALAQARLNLRQSMLDLENQKDQIYVEVKNAVRSVEANYKRILAYTKARELAEQKLAAEEEKRRVGMSTNYMVLSYQRDLANARISELNAIVSYNISIAALEKSMGTNLKSKNINFTDYVPERP